MHIILNHTCMIKQITSRILYHIRVYVCTCSVARLLLTKIHPGGGNFPNMIKVNLHCVKPDCNDNIVGNKYYEIITFQGQAL